MTTRVGFVVHVGRPEAIAAASDLIRYLDGLGDVKTYELPDEEIGASERRVPEAFSEDLDLVVSVGGDGTLLRAVRLASANDCPVVGVNVGRVGFLTEVEPGDARELLRRAIDDKVVIEERLAVVAEPDGEAVFEPQWALNEIMIEKLARHRLVRLAVCVDGTYVTTFSADGVIVATPTGSTAYSFSARGPIVSPTVACLILTPVAAHMVFDRSFVLDASQLVTLEVVGEVAGLLSADGREAIELPVGARVRIRAASRPARLVRRDESPSFLGLVRDKFGLPGASDVTHGG